VAVRDRTLSDAGAFPLHEMARRFYSDVNDPISVKKIIPLMITKDNAACGDHRTVAISRIIRIAK